MKSQKTKFASIFAAALIMLVGTNLQAQNDGPPQRHERGKQEMHQKGPQGKQEEVGPRGPRIQPERRASKSDENHSFEIRKGSAPIKKSSE